MAEALGISLRQLALRLSRDKGGLSRAARDGRIPRLSDGSFDEAAVRSALQMGALTPPVDDAPRQHPVINTVETVSLVRKVLADEGQDIGQDDLTLTHVRMAVGILKARELSVENARLNRDLISIDEVGCVVEAEYSTIRANFSAMAGDIASDCEGLDAAAIEEVIATKVSEILNELSADSEYASEGKARQGEGGGA